MRVTALAEATETTGKSGLSIPGLEVTCERCGHVVEVYGTSDRSARRAGVMLSEECPRGENNFYVVNGDDIEDESGGWDSEDDEGRWADDLNH